MRRFYKAVNRGPVPGPTTLFPWRELKRAGLGLSARLPCTAPSPRAHASPGASAGTGEFWGINAKFFSALHAKYGPVVKFWLGPSLYMSFARTDHIAHISKHAKGRPPLAETLLPFLGRKNLLFQPTGKDGGAFVKQLRLRYGKMVNGQETQRRVHAATLQMLRETAADWGEAGGPVDVYEAFKVALYDVMGSVLFGQAWSDHAKGGTIFRLHRQLIEGSMQLGISFLRVSPCRGRPRHYTPRSHPRAPPSAPLRPGPSARAPQPAPCVCASHAACCGVGRWFLWD